MNVNLAVILVAGEGRRLAPYTQDRPKCLVPVGKASFLERNLEILKKFSFSEVCLVTGYREDKVEQFLETFEFPHKIHICQNSEFDRTNNAYSLWAGLKEYADQPFLLIDGDLLFEEKLLRKLLEDPYDNLMAVETSPEKLTGEAMKVVCDPKDSHIRDLSKEIPVASAGGEYIGMAKFSVEWMKALKFKLRHCEARQEGRQWYYEDAIRSLLKDESPVKALPIDGLAWAEVDTPEDLAAASRDWG